MRELIKKVIKAQKEIDSATILGTKKLQHAAHESVEAGTFGEEKGKHSEREDY